MQIKSIELQGRGSSAELLNGGTTATKLRSSSPSPMWVLASDSAAQQDIRSLLKTLPGGNRNAQLEAADALTQRRISACVSRDASRSATGTAREGSAPPHFSREFYHLEVAVDGPEGAGSSHQASSMSDWRFDVTVTQQVRGSPLLRRLR